MSFPPASGLLLRLSRLFLRIRRWVMVAMPSTCKMSGSNGKLPPNYKIIKKAKEPSAVPNCSRNWRKKLFYLWLLLIVAIGIAWSFRSYSDSGLAGKSSSTDFCEEVQIEHFNVSKNQLHALASLFSEYDQVASIKCTRETGSDHLLTNRVGCALKVLCSEKNGVLKQHLLVTRDPGPVDQCPVQNEEADQAHDLSKLEGRLRSLVSQCETMSISADNLCISEGILRNTEERRDGQCETSSFCLVKRCWWIAVAILVSCKVPGLFLKWQRHENLSGVQSVPVAQPRQLLLQQRQQQQILSPPKGSWTWRKKLLVILVVAGVALSIWLFWFLNKRINLWREETLANMCDERARMLQDQFNVSMNHVHALAILVSTFHHGKNPSAIDQKTFGEYTERTAFERPLTSGVAYALKVIHSEREQFERQHGWTIKKMEFDDQTLVQDCSPGNLDPAPDQDEYAPVIFSQETVSHIVSIDMMSGKEDRENILRARASGKGVLTSPFKLLKSNHLGVVLTFAVYNKDLPLDATPEQRTEATVGYLGASYDVPSLVEKLLHQLASKQTIVVNVYDTTNKSYPINMYGDDVVDTGLLHISGLDFGDPLRKHEMHCRFKQTPPWPLTAILASLGALVITLLVGYIFKVAIDRIAEVEEDYRQMMELKSRAEAADVAKSQFLATVSHEIRTPMNGVLGMLQMLMDTDLDANQMDYAQTAHTSGKELISLINEVLDQAKIESGRLELENVPFDLRAVLDNVLSLFSGKSNEKHIELAVYVSNKVPEIVIGDPGRFRQIITNLVGNSIKFTREGHIFVSVHLAEEVQGQADVNDKMLSHGFSLAEDTSYRNCNTLSGFPVVERWKSWEKFKKLNGTDRMEEHGLAEVLVTVEDTGIGIPLDAQSRIFTPFMQADSSTSRTYGGTGIGLSISKCLVVLMHGEIGFVSEPGRGSTFSFTVPLPKCRGNYIEPKLQNHDAVVTDFRGLRALVIDKRGVRAEVTRYHLQRLGISVDIACNLTSACTYISGSRSTGESSDFSMVLIHKDVWDAHDHSALNLLAKLRQSRKKVSVDLPKIFLLATSINSSERSKLKSAGFVDNILMMPLRLSVLIACFQEALGDGKRKLGYRKKPSNLGSLLRERRILVVDDNMVNRRVAEGALKKYGAIVTCVESGKAALEMLHPPHNFHACFMDLQMPGMDGFQATRQIRSIEKEFNKIASGEESAERSGNVAYWRTPILAMTADVTQASNEECMKCGMDDYVYKPFEEEQLYSAVARFFESG